MNYDDGTLKSKFFSRFLIQLIQKIEYFPEFSEGEKHFIKTSFEDKKLFSK